MKFHIISQGAAKPGVSKLWLEARAKKVWQAIRKSGRKVPDAQFTGLIFVNSSEMKKLNKQYRGKGYATDVLSFAPSEPGSLGELVFCVEVLKRQALEHKLSYRDELTYMLIHGLLHLLGYDHEKSKAQARLMFEIQDNLFEKFRS